MEAAGAILAKLMGGGMDGDKCVLSPHGSVGPPHQLCYLDTDQDEAMWAIYEADLLSLGWPVDRTDPDDPTSITVIEVEYHYIGKYSLNRQVRKR